MIEIRVVEHGSPEYWKAVELRREVLRVPLALDFSPEELSLEGPNMHLIALLDEQVVGTLMLSPLDTDLAQIRQVAVSESFQRQSVGMSLMREAERIASDLKTKQIFLHSRVEAIPFYEKLGFRCEGERFIEVNIDHQKMIKQLIAN